MLRLQTQTGKVAPLLMLSPLLAVSDSLINALGLSMVALLVTLVASVPMSITLRRLPHYGRIAAAAIIAAGAVTSAMLVAHAWFYDLYLAIGPYLPLLVGCGVLLSRSDVDAPERRRGALVFAALRAGLTFSGALILLGAAREVIGRGSLLHGAAALPGRVAERLNWQLFTPDLGFVLAILPPGAFIAMGLLIASRNGYAARRSR